MSAPRKPRMSHHEMDVAGWVLATISALSATLLTVQYGARGGGAFVVLCLLTLLSRIWQGRP